MKPNVRDAVLGVIAIVAVVGLIAYARRSPVSNSQSTPFQTTTPIGTVQGVEDTFKVTIPEDMDKKDLKDVSNENASYGGIASRKIENNTSNFIVLADLPDTPLGQSYKQSS